MLRAPGCCCQLRHCPGTRPHTGLGAEQLWAVLKVRSLVQAWRCWWLTPEVITAAEPCRSDPWLRAAHRGRGCGWRPLPHASLPVLVLLPSPWAVCEEQEHPAGTGPGLAAARSCQECSELVPARLSRERSRRVRLARCRPERKQRDFPVLRETSGRAGGQREQRRHHLPPKGPLHVPPGPTQPAFLSSSPPCLQLLFPCSLSISVPPAPSPVPARAHAALPLILFSAAGVRRAPGPASAGVKSPIIALLEAAVGSCLSVHPSSRCLLSGHTCPLYWESSW